MVRQDGRRRARLSRAALAVVLAGVIGSAGCGGDGDSGSPREGREPQVVRVGVLPTSGIAPLYLGRDKGFFEQRGIELDLQVAAGGAAIVPAVISGDLDIGYGASVSSAIANAKGLPIKIVAQGIIGASEETNSINKLVVSKSSPIRSPTDLEGGTIAVNTLGSVAEIGIKATLEEHGVDLSKVEFVELALPEMPAALEKGRVDAIWGTEPFLSELEAGGARSLYAWDVEFVPDASLASYFAGSRFIEEQRATLDRFVDAVNESLTYAQAHPEEVRETIPKYLEIPPKAAQSMTLPIWGTDLHADTIERQAQAAVKYGVIDEAPDMSDLIYAGS
jgi:ABC-type nitrate/sulfonate/bicarbonate transport system substrate-binding protein